MARFGVGLAFGFMLLCDMAKELTHIVVARKVLNDLKEAGHRLLAQLLDKSLSAYYLGAIIPDAFFYEMSPLRRVSRDYAHVCRALHLGETARNDQLAVGVTKQAINHSYDIAGMREALLQALELDIVVEATETDESREFNRILRDEGTKAAIAWRDARLAGGA